MSPSNPAVPEIFPRLEELDGGAADGSPRRVCIACAELSGPDTCGGVGTAMRALALALAEEGHDVSVVFVTLPQGQVGAETWRGFFAESGIRFIVLAPPDSDLDWGTFSRPASILCYEWLRDQPAFDVIHFHDYMGLGYYAQLAKGQGLAFTDTTICVGAHGNLRWDRIGNRRFGSGNFDLTLDFLERQSVERADIVVSPSQHLLRWMRQDGWRLPARSCVQANLLEAVPTVEGVEVRSRGVPVGVDELVFFGRLDGRKGLDLFIDAVEALVHRGEPCPKLTFLGRPVLVGGKPAVDFIQARAGRLGRRPQLLTRMSRDEALHYLRSGPRLAVMPSRLDNAPCTVQECLAASIPFLTTDVGGIPELIRPEDRATTTCAPSPDRLAERFTHILKHGQELARPAPLLDEPRRGWLAWHRSLPRSSASRPREVVLPSTTVCVAHHERPELLEQALRALRAQTWKDFELIVVDDGSQSPAVLEALERIEAEMPEGWRLLRQENAGPGAARNAAARHADSEILLFLDDDDVPDAGAVETFARAMAHTNADAMTCGLKRFVGDEPPGADTPIHSGSMPLGSALVLSLYGCDTGGTAICVRREVFEQLGGFPVQRGIDEDWMLLVDLIGRGFELEVIPEYLIWYRYQPSSRSRSIDEFERTSFRMRLFEKMLPEPLRPLIEVAYGGLSGVHNLADLRRALRLERLRERHAIARAKAGRDRTPS